MRGDIFSSKVKTKEAEFLKNLQAAEGLYGKRNYIFQNNLCWYQFVVDFFFVFSLVWEKCL